jgi:hypothetical protein
VSSLGPAGCLTDASCSTRCWSRPSRLFRTELLIGGRSAARFRRVLWLRVHPTVARLHCCAALRRFVHSKPWPVFSRRFAGHTRA